MQQSSNFVYLGLPFDFIERGMPPSISLRTKVLFQLLMYVQVSVCTLFYRFTYQNRNEVELNWTKYLF